MGICRRPLHISVQLMYCVYCLLIYHFFSANKDACMHVLSLMLVILRDDAGIFIGSVATNISFQLPLLFVCVVD